MIRIEDLPQEMTPLGMAVVEGGSFSGGLIISSCSYVEPDVPRYPL